MLYIQTVLAEAEVQYPPLEKYEAVQWKQVGQVRMPVAPAPRDHTLTANANTNGGINQRLGRPSPLERHLGGALVVRDQSLTETAQWTLIRPHTLEVVLSTLKTNPSDASFPKVFNLLKDDRQDMVA